jgi:hypothetical protein
MYSYVNCDELTVSLLVTDDERGESATFMLLMEP